MEVLRLEHVSMKFGDHQVLEDVSFSLKENSVFGFIGKNGSGKTTTMKIILGFLKPDKGNIYVCGEKVTYGNTKTNQLIGYLPDVPEFYGYMKPKEYLRLCGEISGLHSVEIKRKSEELLHIVGLEGVNRKISGFSRGMKQRLGIAQALMTEPKLLICDEPTSALDPIGRKEILDILKAVKGETTVLFSTHILSDVERICDSIGILDAGRLQLTGNLSEIKEKHNKHMIRIELFEQAGVEMLIRKLQKEPYVVHVDTADFEISIQLDRAEASKSLLEQVVKENVHIKKYEVVESALENVFFEVVK